MNNKRICNHIAKAPRASLQPKLAKECNYDHNNMMT